jgi:uncharacterized protein YbjT (DUF2867 family)
MVYVLVFGASRGIGLETVKAALDAGHRVRAFARSAVPVEHPMLDVVTGDALDRVAVERALDGVDVVVQVLGAPKQPDVYIGGTNLFSRATRTLVDAMTARGPKRLIVVTGLGAGDSRGHGGFLYDRVLFALVLDRVYRDKDVQEQIVRRSNLDWTIVRPGQLNNGPPTGKARAFTNPADWRAGPVTRADVARFLVAQVTDRTYLRQTPLLIEP